MYRTVLTNKTNTQDIVQGMGSSWNTEYVIELKKQLEIQLNFQEVSTSINHTKQYGKVIKDTIDPDFPSDLLPFMEVIKQWYCYRRLVRYPSLKCPQMLAGLAMPLAAGFLR